MLGYEKWERFADAVSRASTSLETQGYDPLKNVSRLREPIAKTTREDFHLSRFTAYLVAMNGDPHKPAVAAASPLGVSERRGGAPQSLTTSGVGQCLRQPAAASRTRATPASPSHPRWPSRATRRPPDPPIGTDHHAPPWLGTERSGGRGRSPAPTRTHTCRRSPLRRLGAPLQPLRRIHRARIE
jgi:hypothetical protein